MINPWIILAILVAFILLVGGLILIVWMAQRRDRQVTRGPGAKDWLCPTCRRPLPAGAAACPHCTPRLSVQPGPALIVVSGPAAGKIFALQPPPRGLVIGRNPDSDVILDAVMVSRHHAQVMLEGDQAVLYDRDSTNGTWFIDGRRVSRHVLSIGDRFQIGDTVFVYAIPGQPLPPPSSPVLLPPVVDLQPGSCFEGYTLVEMLGHGGMSVVYRAQAADGSSVAIKVLDITDQWVARKFVQEGNIGVALRGHPHIRTVFDLRYSQDHRPYLVMEYVDGASLRKLAGKGLSTAQAINLIGQTCEALDFAHQRQVVHRDIKPENILVTADGTVKVTDFGIAKMTSAVTVTNDRIVGTPEYISPEQAKGEAVNAASDIYSLGVVLYELLTGQVPFPLPATGSNQDDRGAAYAVIRQHIHAAPLPPGQLNPALTPVLEKATLKALEKDPSKRYNRAMALAEELGYQPSQLPLPPTAAFTKAQLVILDGPNRGQVIPVESGSLTLGRMMIDPHNTQISRQHALVIQKGQEWWVQDISMNGTWLNGQRVYGEAPLTGDKVIEIAGYKLQLQPSALGDSNPKG